MGLGLTSPQITSRPAPDVEPLAQALEGFKVVTLMLVVGGRSHSPLTIRTGAGVEGADVFTGSISSGPFRLGPHPERRDPRVSPATLTACPPGGNRPDRS